MKSSCEVDRIPEEHDRPSLGTNPIGNLCKAAKTSYSGLSARQSNHLSLSLSLSLSVSIFFISSPVSPRLAIVDCLRLFYSIHRVFQILYRLGALPIILLLG